MSNGSSNVSNVFGVGGTLANAPGATIPVTNAASFITLIAGANGAPGSGSFYPFMRQDTGAAYQVTAGKTFRALGFYLFCNDGSASSSRFQFVRATAAFTYDSGAAPAGVVYYSGANGRYNIANQTSSTTHIYHPWPISIPASNFFAWQGNSSSITYFMLIGQEV